MAVRMRKVLARPWIGVRVCHLLLLLLHKFTWPTDRQLRLIHLPSACRGRTAVRFPATSSHMCCVDDMAVRKRKVLARSGDGVRVCHLLLLLQCVLFSKSILILPIKQRVLPDEMNFSTVSAK